MGDSTGNIYFPGRSSRIPHSRQPSNSDESNILPHFLAPLPCEPPFYPYLGAGENAQNISVQFMHSCPGQDNTQLDSDILQRRLIFNDESPSMAPHPIVYPESSQRTTSHALSPYASDASKHHNFSSCDLSTLHIADAPLHGTQTFRRGSWPSHAQTGYPPWTQSPPRIPRSPASEPPESTSDESYQDSDVEEVTRMSPMMNQFQIQSSRNVDLSPHHTYRTQALQPSVMTFQLSESMLQPVDDPENRHMLNHLLDMNIVADDESEVTHPSPSSISFGGARLQGPGMRLQRDGEVVTTTSQFRVPVPSPNSVPFPLAHSPANSRVGDQRPTGSKHQKKSKMHQCEQCKKMFPRPSGLATHMNSHSGAKPYKCNVANCDKSFAVRSNAKRHLRTHGINPSSSDILSAPRFAVGFEEPMVTQVHDAGKQPASYRWIPHNQSHEGEWHPQGSSSSVAGGSRTGLTFQVSMSSATSSSVSNGSDDDYDEVASSSVADTQQYQNDYNRGTDEVSGAYPNYRKHSR
ncbi:hypothetical protein J3R82DRAFT_7216 [Butyriboletus roseoflavus]|nr:hypothetical protein J3R82DRAFT_7216 [Butyriboletus roseoflavus]